MSIKYICKTVSSKTDTSGNRYHFGTITNTKTGETLKITGLGGDSNLPHLVRENRPDLDWSEIYTTNSTEMIRPWNRYNKFHKKGAVYEHERDVIAEWFKAS